MNNALSSRIHKLHEHGLTAQPLPVAVGSSLLNISAYYLIINGNEFGTMKNFVLKGVSNFDTSLVLFQFTYIISVPVDSTK